jgi:hypothetical protein
MTEEHEPTIEELKAEERIEIPVEEVEEQKERAQRPDVSDALRDLGRQFAETLQAAWNSQERKEFEQEVQEGVRRFADEVNRVFKEAKESPTTQKVKEEAKEVRTKVETGELGRKARGGLVEGLTWMSQELARMAEQFSPPEKGPESTAETESTGTQDVEA